MLILLLFLALQACSPKQAPTDPCAPYAAMPDAHGLCMARRARFEMPVEQMEAICRNAGSWKEECVTGWVRGQLGQPGGSGTRSTERLLAACGSSADCALTVVEARALPDVLEQVDMCVRHTGSLVQDCIGHAFERWWASRPPVAEVDRVLDAPIPTGRALESLAGTICRCRSDGSCEGDLRRVPGCLEAPR